MKKIIALALILIPQLCFGAVAFNTSAAASVSPGTTQAVTLTVGAGSNRALFVIYGYDVNTTAGSAPTGAGATWAVAACGTFNAGSPMNGRIEVWVGTNPSTGSQTVTGHLSPSATNSMHVISMNGVNQTTPCSGFTTQNSTANPFSLTLTTTSGDAVISFAISQSEPLGSAAGACNGANDPTDQAPGSFFYVAGHCLSNSGTTKIGFTNPAANAGQVAFVVNQVSSAVTQGARLIARGRLIVYGRCLIQPK